MPTTALSDLVAAAVKSAAEQPFPESTYRLQFHAKFTFRDAAAIVPYLKELGITHVYASPYLKARKGSTHGYDIIDHRVINPEIGSPEDHDAFVAAVREHGLRLILDIVPNHMGVATTENAWWNDVLENGPSSPFAGYFDIAWNDTARPQLQQKVLLPVLGDPYGQVLESGQLKLLYDSGHFRISYYERWFPVAPRSYSLILGQRQDELEKQLGAESLDLAEYQSILTAIKNLPDRTETGAERVNERHREKEVIKRRLGELTAKNGAIRGFIEENVATFNGTPGIPHSFDLLDELLSHQCYRLSFWRVALEEINYRRFFDVNELAAICVEREDVFSAIHQLIFLFIKDGKVDGLRVDHPDGLYDPREYFRRLQRHYLLTLARRSFESGGQRGEAEWPQVEAQLGTQIDGVLSTSGEAPRRWPLFVVAEKILGANEPLPDDWEVSGAVGYEFIRAVTELFIDGKAESAFNRLYRELLPEFIPFADVLYRTKRLILNASLAAELNMLSIQLDRLAQKSRRSRDFTLNGLREALREIIACFPVYRSYISERGVSERDRQLVETAVRWAGSRNPMMNGSVLRFVGDMLLLKYPDGATEQDQAEQRRFVGKFQQLTSPVMAKGLEDTAFYRYHRLISLNEVGGVPEWPKDGLASLHRFNADRQAKWPYSLSPLSTHDTKRSEDVRARIHALSEMPREWSEAVQRWMNSNAANRPGLDGNPAPDDNEEYLIYQTLLGAWPTGSSEASEEFINRIKAYLEKALREAKVHSSWLNPNAQYDGAVQEFVVRILSPERGRAFLDDFLPFQRRVAAVGAINSLAQTLLKLTAPGVADTYQGTELPDFSLVDPDNRRPVDYELRRKMLQDLRGRVESAKGDLSGLARELSDGVEDGRAKLFVNWRVLQTRRQFPGLFGHGDYTPLTPSGAKANHLFAFARRLGGKTAVVAVPRLVLQLGQGQARVPLGAEIWGDTTVSLSPLKLESSMRNVFTGSQMKADCGEFSAAGLFAHFPVALLLND
jgi:(1->4)-alpha-D-glucan 1-alpha-D-glucosylmutase